ncbi:MAG TPA: 4'-phosphopantetheinyl transferase superfamily protein [Ramlibacter sp.]|uniref:4'-phosphopantetheinyl transferase family protein n=1 Tax=Ramlibacter sp. TaxID=1917967 RepID=UPI002ED3C4E3
MSALVACARSAACLPQGCGWLSGEEAARLAAITATQRREQFLAARWLARGLLAQAAGGEPQDWSLTAGEAVKPTVIGHPEWHVAIAHSGEWVACAVAREAIGIDLEAPARRRDIEGLVRLCCTEREQQLFAGLDASAQEALFHELWTVKESWLKRRGEWVAPARLVRVEGQPGEPGEVRTWLGESWVLALCGGQDVRWLGELPLPLRTWQVRDL